MTTAVLAGSLRMGPAEKLNLAISFVNRLTSGEALTGAATTTLTDETDNITYAAGIVTTSTVASPSVTTGIYRLVSGHTYLLDVSVGTTLGQTLEGQIRIICEGKPNLV